MLKIELEQVKAHTAGYLYYIDKYKDEEIFFVKRAVGGNVTEVADNILDDIIQDYDDTDLITTIQVIINYSMAFWAWQWCFSFTEVSDVIITFLYDEYLEENLPSSSWGTVELLTYSEVFLYADFDWMWGC